MTHLYCLQETHFKPKDTHRLKVREWRNIYHANRCQKKVGVAILTSDKLEFFILIYICFKIYLLISEKERKIAPVGGAEGESQADSTLTMEPNVGLNLTALRSRLELTKPKVGHLINCVIQVPYYLYLAWYQGSAIFKECSLYSIICTILINIVISYFF